MTRDKSDNGNSKKGRAWKTGLALATGAGIVAASYEIFCPRATFLGRVAIRGPESTQAVALVFQKAPDPFTEDICRALHQLEIPGTFFIVGERARANPQAAKAMRPFEIGIHSETYTPLVFKASATIRAMIRPAAELAGQIQDRPAAFLMPPYGWKGLGLLSTASSMGLRVVNPSYRLELRNEALAQPIIDTALERIVSGDIVLVSFGEELQRHKVPALLAHLVAGLKSKGLTPWGLRALLDLRI